MNLILEPEKNQINKILLSGLLHYSTIRKEKQELLNLSKYEISKILLKNILSSWKNVKKIISEHKSIKHKLLQKSSEFRLKSVFSKFAFYRKMRVMKKLKKEAAKNFCEKYTLAVPFYAIKSYVEYHKNMKLKVQKLMNKGAIKEKIFDKKETESKNSLKIRQIMHQISQKLSIQIKEILGNSHKTIKIPYNKINPVLENLKEKSLQFNSLRNQRILDALTGYNSVPIPIPYPMKKNESNFDKNLKIELNKTASLKAPNMLYKKLEDKLYKERVPTASFFAQQAFSFKNSIQNSTDIILQLKEHARQALNSIRVLNSLPLNYHRSTMSMNNIKNESIYELTKSKLLSIYFTQWKISFLTKWAISDYKLIRCYSNAKVFFEYLRNSQYKKTQNFNEISRILEMKKVCKILRNWKILKENLVVQNAAKIEKYKKKRIFKKWKEFIVKTAQKLMKIIKANEYYQNKIKKSFLITLKSKILPKLQIKSQFRLKTISKFMQIWSTNFRKMRIFNKLSIINSKQIAKKYAEQYSQIQKCFKIWLKKTKRLKNKEIHRIKLLTAENFRIGHLLSKSYFLWKNNTRLLKGVHKLNPIVFTKILEPTLKKWREQTSEYAKTLMDFEESRKKIVLAQCFMGWKQEALNEKIIKMFTLKTMVRAWWRFVTVRRIMLPMNHYELITKKKCFDILKERIKNRWNKKRSKIIYKELNKRHLNKLQKLVLISLLENVMQMKKYFSQFFIKNIGKK